MRLNRVVAAMTATMMTASVAGAQNGVNFAGSTSGCFYTTSAAPTTCSGLSSSTGSLTYTGSTFNATSNAADGLFSLGAAPGTGTGGANLNNLGSFRLVDGMYNYTGQRFALFLNFTNPMGASGNTMYTAMLTGNLSSSTSGNVFVDFGNTPRTFTFGNGTTLNSFVVNNVSINDQANPGAGVTVAVTGQGYARGATVPEPSSLALLGTGLVGLVPMFRRRK